MQREQRQKAMVRIATVVTRREKERDRQTKTESMTRYYLHILFHSFSFLRGCVVGNLRARAVFN